MKKRYFVIWRTLDGENTSAGTVIMATNDKAKAYSYGRRNLPCNRELIIEGRETSTIIHRELRA